MYVAFKRLADTALFFLIFAMSALSQHYNYVQFTTKDGLPGMTVYDICQDRDGFIWCATDNGLARFDGKRFKTFTIEEGLPDNDVLTVLSDKKGRVWIGTFKNEVSYYYKGRIYNKYNDTLLAKINIQRSVNHFHETSFGSIMISDLDNFYEVASDGRVKVIYKKAVTNQPDVGSLGYDWLNGRYGFVIGDSLFEYNGNFKKFVGEINLGNLRKFVFGRPSVVGDTPKLEIPYTPIRITAVKGMPLFVSTINGSYEVDTNKLRFNNTFLQEKTVSNTITDKEGNLWFSTIGFGLYKLSIYSKEINRVYSKLEFQEAIYSFNSLEGNVYLGLGNSKLAIYQKSGIKIEINYQKYLDKRISNASTNRVNAILPLKDRSILLGFDAFLLKESFHTQLCYPISAIKNFHLTEDGNVILTAGNGVYLFDPMNFKVKDTLFSKRGLDAVEFGNYYYIATLSGLKRISKQNGEEEDLSRIHPALARRINDLQPYNNKLWISTADKGLICFFRDTVAIHLTQEKGLSSNNCKKVFTSKNELWLSTNKGISKINLLNPFKSIIVFDESDLLRSEMVNDVWVNDEEVWVATNAGLTFFNKSDVNPSPYCNLNVESINGNYYDRNSNNSVTLEYKAPFLNVEFLAISLRSAGRIKYFYKLNGYDSAFIETTGTIASYNEIPSGSYKFIVFAENKFGVRSNIISIPVIVKEPFWRSWWFITSIVIATFFLVLAFLLLQQQFFRNKIEERNLLQKHMFNVEQYALQLQLNPHFIFNCLNSVQQYILKNNAEDANRFLAGFSVLIREALNNSSHRFISLNKEIRFLERYLKLEQLRFSNKFSFHIHIDKSIDPEMDVVPVMLLQPYLENAIKHGISNSLKSEGKIELKFLNRGGLLWCIVEDNGIGITVNKQQQPAYSKKAEVNAMRILKRRIEILNETGNYNYILKVTDLSDLSEGFSGTRVEIKLHTVYGASN